MMRVVREAAPVVLGAVLISALITLAGGLWLLDVNKLVGADKDWANPGGIFAMGFFAFMVGLLSTIAIALLARWFPAGLYLFAAASVAMGVWVTIMALDQKPELAPMFIMLHVVFVASFGLILPARFWLHRPVGRRLHSA